MPDDIKLLDYFFGGIIANLPLWLFLISIPVIDPFSPFLLLSYIISGIIGGIIAGYFIRIKSSESYKWAPLIIGILAFSASILILESFSVDFTDVVLLPSFIIGSYIGIKIGEKYPYKRRITETKKEIITENNKEIKEVQTNN